MLPDYIFFFHIRLHHAIWYNFFNVPFFVFFTDTAYRFFGNQTHTDYFKLLRKDGQSLLIGARNVIYNISLPYLTENLDQVSKNLWKLNGKTWKILDVMTCLLKPLWLWNWLSSTYLHSWQIRRAHEYNFYLKLLGSPKYMFHNYDNIIVDMKA